MSKYTAVVYFHGMGSQRRFEETSRLIQTIDDYLSNSYRQRGEKRGLIRGHKSKIEPHHARKNATVTYLQADYVENPSADQKTSTRARFYECYWAPHMVKAKKPIAVFKWMISQVPRPLVTLLTPWRHRQRLRLSILSEFAGEPGKWPKDMVADDINTMKALYDDFDGPSARDDFSDRFAGFLQFISKQPHSHPAAHDRLQRVARAWRRQYVITELKNALYLGTILLALLLSFGFLMQGVLALSEVVQAYLQSNVTLGGINAFLKGQLVTSAGGAASMVTGALLFFGLGKFLTDYMGDVQAWATYNETNAFHAQRANVLNEGVDTLSHVLKDDDCERVIVVAHSLGTSVGLDVLLKIGRQNLVTNDPNPQDAILPLSKISHFVTIASPIDKIDYFFQSTRSDFYRYVRMIQEQRGDLSTLPFSKNRKPHIHWVNYWDRIDFISGSLQSPVSSRSKHQVVDNVHVSSLHMLNPGKAHSAYFQNRTVASGLVEMIFHNKGSYIDLKDPDPTDHKGPDYRALDFGPGTGLNNLAAYFLMAFSVPWLTLIAVIWTWVSPGTGADIATGVAAISLGAVVLHLLVNARRKNRLPL